MKRAAIVVGLGLVATACSGGSGGASSGTELSATAIARKVENMPIPPFNLAHLADMSCKVCALRATCRPSPVYCAS
jgi:hypothetical protein